MAPRQTALMLFLLTSPNIAAAQAPMTEHPLPIIRLPGGVQWHGKPGANQSATILGDPSEPGPFVSITKWVAGSISKPHYHPNARTFVVLKGHWDFGSGSHYDTSAMKALPEGAVVTVPAGGVLYDGCKEAPCIVETVGVGQDPEFMVDENGVTLPSASR